MIDPNWPHGFEAFLGCGTRVGPARLICKDRVNAIKGFNFVFLVHNSYDEEVWSVNEQGRASGFGATNYIKKKPAPKKVLKGWFNVYSTEFDLCGPYETREKADRAASDARIACLYIEREYEEGEGL